MQVERGSELTFASDKLRDASSHCSTVVRGLWIVAVLHAVLMGGYIWSGVSGRAVPLQDLGIALYDDFFGLGVIVVTLLSLSFSAGVAVWWLRWQCAIGRAAGHMGFMMRGWWNLLAWVVPGVNVVAPLVLVGRMARSMRANLPLVFLGAWWLLWLGLSWRQVQLILEPRGEWTAEQAYFTALAMFLWLILDFTAMRVAMGLTVAGWRSLEKVSAERGATETEINVAVAGAQEFSPVQNVSWSGGIRGRGSALGRRVASSSKTALAAASAGTVKAAKKSKSLVESAAAVRKAQTSSVSNTEPPQKEALDVALDSASDVKSLAADEAVSSTSHDQEVVPTADTDNIVDVSDSTLHGESIDVVTDELTDLDAVEEDITEDELGDGHEDAVVDLRDDADLRVEDDDASSDSADEPDDETESSDSVTEGTHQPAVDKPECVEGTSLDGPGEDADELNQDPVVPEVRQAPDDIDTPDAQCSEEGASVVDSADKPAPVVRHSPRNAEPKEHLGTGHDVDEAIDGLITRLGSVAKSTNDK